MPQSSAGLAAGAGAGIKTGLGRFGQGLGMLVGAPYAAMKPIRAGMQAGIQSLPGMTPQGRISAQEAAEVPYYLKRPEIDTAGQGASQGPGDLDALARMIMGDPMEDLARFGQGLRFGMSAPQWGPMSYNRAPAAPNIGPGIRGLQGLIRGGGY